MSPSSICSYNAHAGVKRSHMIITNPTDTRVPGRTCPSSKEANVHKPSSGNDPCKCPGGSRSPPRPRIYVWVTLCSPSTVIPGTSQNKYPMLSNIQNRRMVGSPMIISSFISRGLTAYEISKVARVISLVNVNEIITYSNSHTNSQEEHTALLHAQVLAS